MVERYSSASTACAEEEDSSHLLANALKKMDGLIGDFKLEDVGAGLLCVW